GGAESAHLRQGGHGGVGHLALLEGAGGEGQESLVGGSRRGVAQGTFGGAQERRRLERIELGMTVHAFTLSPNQAGRSPARTSPSDAPRLSPIHPPGQFSLRSGDCRQKRIAWSRAPRRRPKFPKTSSIPTRSRWCAGCGGPDTRPTSSGAASAICCSESAPRTSTSPPARTPTRSRTRSATRA